MKTLRTSILLTGFLQLLFTLSSYCQILHVGSGYPIATLPEATSIAVPGDTIYVHEGIYNGGIFVGDLQGTAAAWIYIHAAPGEEVIFEGGNNAWQFSDAAYLHIRGFTYEHQTGNGLNFDDGGSYVTPAHHVIFEHCIFRDMSASGNNDLLKLSGLDNFEIRQCTFLNGAEGGSGIDMVGCHDGLIKNCHFENLGSNSIQAKGGTRNIRIQANFFRNGGARAVNLGGSTGLQFFRPIDAPYEAAELKVYSNIFIGSEAPIAFVGCINSEVVNNTMYLPGKWVLRILQETVDLTRFPPCGFNTFRNNIIYLDNQVTVECNIGPDTAPETFTFSNNLWYHSQDSGWSGPGLPVSDLKNIIGEDPMFADAAQEDFSLLAGSPAIGHGLDVEEPQLDFIEVPYNSPRSIGAFEGNEITGTIEINREWNKKVNVYPNPSNGAIKIALPEGMTEKVELQLFDLEGRILLKKIVRIDNSLIISTEFGALMPGTYIIYLKSKGIELSQLVIVD